MTLRLLFSILISLATLTGCGGEKHDPRGDIYPDIMYDLMGRPYIILSNGCRLIGDLPAPEIKEDADGSFYSDPITNLEGYDKCEDMGWRLAVEGGREK